MFQYLPFLPLFALSSVTTLIYLVAFSRRGKIITDVQVSPREEFKSPDPRCGEFWWWRGADRVSSPPFGWNFRGRIIWNVCSHSCGRASVGVHSRRNYCKFTSTPVVTPPVRRSASRVLFVEPNR